MTNTQANIGIRRMIHSLAAPEHRCFEGTVDATVAYNAYRHHLEFLGTVYTKGQTLPFDVGGTSYSKKAVQILELYWNNAWIVPAV